MIVFGAIDYSVALAQSLSDYCNIDFYINKYYLEEKDPSILDVIRNRVQINLYGNYRIRDIRSISIYYELCKDILKKNYDIIHLQEYGPPWLAIFWGIFRKIPLVMTVHDPYQHTGIPFHQKLYQDIMQRIFINKAKKIIVHGRLLKKQFLERYQGKESTDVVVIPHGDFKVLHHWDKNRRKDKEKSPKNNVLFFGTIRPNKGLEYLLKAEPIIRNQLSDYKIIIAGKFDDFRRYQRYINQNSKIEIINKYIPNCELPKYLNNASFVVLPYLSATQTGIIPLAYSFGKPVIATKVGSIPEIVEDGINGLLVEPKNEKVLANAIVRLISDDSLVKKMSNNAKNYCKKNLSWDSIAIRTILLYKDLVNKSNV
ncbi:MAG: glycosyltransferase family 4 protein [Candidatus Helarchaeota archaeon]